MTLDGLIAGTNSVAFSGSSGPFVIGGSAGRAFLTGGLGVEFENDLYRDKSPLDRGEGAVNELGIAVSEVTYVSEVT